MDFIHARKYLGPGQAVRVDCDTQCNVQLMDDLNLQAFRSGRNYRSVGAWYKAFPAVLAPPHTGYWNVTIDLAGGSAQIQASITVVNLP